MPGPQPPMGAGIAQVLQQLMQNPGQLQGMLGQLMQDPVAMQGMQNFMQGQSPTAGMPQPLPEEMLAPGGPPPTSAGMGDMPPEGGEMPPEGGDPAEMAAMQQIDQAGGTWDGVDAPTQNDIDRLMEDPSEANIASFNAQFGDGAAEKYLGESAEGEEGPATDVEAEPEYDE